MPSSWVNVSPGKKMVWKRKRFSFSRPEIVITAQTQIATTSVSVNTTFFMFVLRLDSMLGYSLALAPILGFSLESTNLLPHHYKMDTKDGAPDRHTSGFIRRVTHWVGIARLGKKRSQRFCLDFCGGPIPGIIWAGGLAWPVQSRDPREFSNCSGRQRDSYLYRSRSLSHRIGSADGTRPQPMRTDQKHIVASCYVCERD